MAVDANGYFLGTAGDDLLDRATSVTPVKLAGLGGNDTLNGGSGNDRLYGNSPSAVPGAADGGDVLNGGAGSDYLQGNAGEDTLRGGDGGDRLYGGAGNDDLEGGEGQDYLQGNRGADDLEGGAGNDILRGGADNDDLDGGSGNDQLFGDAGDDDIQGGLGIDHLTGGAGRDTFEFDQNDALITGETSFAVNETIRDFADGQDLIDLDFDVAQVLTVTGRSFADVASARAFATELLVADPGVREVAAVAVGSDTWLFFNGAGSDQVDSAIRLEGVQAATIDVRDFD